MDFLKKHFEKVALAAGLLLLIASAVYLSFRLNEVNQPPAPINVKGPAAPPMDLTTYAKAIESLNSPPQWKSSGQDMFSPVKAEAPLPPPEIPTNGPPVVLLRVVREPFKLLFKAYIGEGRTFQLNFQFRPRTFFVEKVGDYVEDRFENTGYKLIKFGKKIIEVEDPQIGRKTAKDVSELTIQHEGEDPITLVLGREAQQQEPVALVQCGSGAQSFKVRRGQRFSCAGKTYIVVDMTPTQMIIVDEQTKEKHTIGPSGSN
jgi:hypothetical protein